MKHASKYNCFVSCHVCRIASYPIVSSNSVGHGIALSSSISYIGHVIALSLYIIISGMVLLHYYILFFNDIVFVFHIILFNQYISTVSDTVYRLGN